MDYLLDTNHASGLLFDRVDKSRIPPDAILHLSLPVISELWFMVFNSRRIVENEKRLLQFMSAYEIAPFDDTAAIEYGRIRAELRKKGKPIPQIDNQIAGIARSRDIPVLTADAHFSFIDHLKTENWLA